MSLKAARFLEANATSPVVYGSVMDNGGCVYRLRDGSAWTLTAKECRDVGQPRWAHLAHLSGAS